MLSFDELTKGLANSGVSRRNAVKLGFGGVAAAALAALGVGSAAAAPQTYPNCYAVAGTCSSGFSNCTRTNTNCYCFEHINKTTTGCGCNVYCSQAPACLHNYNCSTGYFCSDNNGCVGCAPGTGVCIQKCNKYSTCVLSSVPAGSNGKTAA
jgi:hypothetical protein